MIKSHVVEASSFTQSQVDIKLPQVLCSSLKLCHLGVYGGSGYPVNGILGQLNVISSIELMDGATVLSSYTDNLKNYLEYVILQQSNNKNRSLLKATHCSNYGFVLNNGGSDSAVNLVNKTPAVLAHETNVRPRVCVDKRALKKSQVAEADSDLAVLDLSLVLGFLNAQYKIGSDVVPNLVPCHLFNNPKLRIKFNSPANVCENATTVAQPYLIFDEVVDQQLSDAFMKSKNNLLAEFTDYELESFLSSSTSANNYLNGFYGKQVGQLVFMIDQATSGSPFQSGEEFKMTVNNNSLLSLTSGINHEGKKAMYLRQSGIDLDIPTFSDRIVDLCGDLTTNANASNDTVYEGGGNSKSTETNFYNDGRLSYLALPLDIKVDSLQLQYSRGLATPVIMLFWGEVGKILSFDKNTGATTVSYL